MEYSFIERTAKHQGHNWFGHQIKVYVTTGKQSELEAFLTESVGPKGRLWRKAEQRHFSLFSKSDTLIRFKEKSHAMLFKLAWEEETWDDYWGQYIRKISLNSAYGRIGGIGTTLPTWNTGPITHATPGIYPAASSTGKTNTALSTQQTGRSQRCAKPGDIVIMDYESALPSTNWYDSKVVQQPCETWQDYTSILHSMVNMEGQVSYDDIYEELRQVALSSDIQFFKK